MIERKGVLTGCAIAGLTFAAAFALIAKADAQVDLIVAAALLACGGILLQLVLDRARDARLLRGFRIAASTAMTVAGAASIAYSFGIESFEGWTLGGVCLFYLGLGQVLAEWRSTAWLAPGRGPVWCAICLTGFAAGIALCLLVDAYWLLLAGGAVLLAPIGLTLLSEDVMKRRLPLPPRQILAGALAAVAGMALLVVLLEIPPGLTLALAAVLAVLVLAIASSSQADVLLVVTVALLILTAVPEPESRSEVLEVERGGRTLVSLGDSYMSGEGALKFFDGTHEPDRNECRRSPTAYAYEIVAPGREGAFARLAFLACSGAKAKHLHLKAQYPGEPIDDTPERGAHQLEQLTALLGDRRENIRLVLVSIGGNDAGFANIGTACIAPRSCVALAHRWLTGLDEVGRKVEEAFGAVRAAVGDEAPVLAVPYPQPIRPTPCDESLLDRDEHRFLHGFVSELNGVVRQAARDARFYFLDEMESAFGQEMRICDRGELGVNFIALDSAVALLRGAAPQKWIHNSLHPNESGHERMRQVLEAWLRDHRTPDPEPTGEDLPAPFTRTPTEELIGDVAYCGAARGAPAHCDRDENAWAISQVAIHLIYVTGPLLLLAGGLWLLVLPLLGYLSPEVKRITGPIAKRVLGELSR